MSENAVSSLWPKDELSEIGGLVLRLWKILLLGVLLMGETSSWGCKRKEDLSEAHPERAQIKRLTFWHIMHYPGPLEVLRDAVERFEKATPGVKVEVTPIKNDDFKTKLQIEMASGTPPDVFHTWGGGKLASYAQAGKVLELTEALKEDNWGESFLPMALQFCRADGRAYAVPLDISVVALWYDARLFREHGLNPATTWEEFLGLCRTLQKKNLIPLALGNRDQWPGAFFFIYLANRLGGTALFEAAARREASFAHPAFVEAGRKVRELVELNVFPVGFNGLGDDQARRLFFTGRAAMMLMGSWIVARCKTEAPELMEHLTCAPFPILEGGKGDPTAVVGGTNAAFAISSRCAHPREAIRLLRFLTDQETAAAWTKIGRMTAVRVKSGVTLPPPSQNAAKLLEAAREIQLYYDQYLPPALAELHKETTQGIFTGDLTPEGAAEKMEKATRESAD